LLSQAGRVANRPAEVKVAVLWYLLASTIPESGVIGSCCSLMVTVPLDGFDHCRVNGSPAVTSNVDWPSGIRMALLLLWADTAAAQSAATTVLKKRMLIVSRNLCDNRCDWFGTGVLCMDDSSEEKGD
ncbi:hypothetical protein KCU88_g464, partial [Aureobasidium melanogenum]